MESGVDSRSIKLDDAFLAVSPAEATMFALTQLPFHAPRS